MCDYLFLYFFYKRNYIVSRCIHNNASGKKEVESFSIESPERRADNLWIFCAVITAQVDYITALGDKDSYMMQVKEILCKTVASPSPATSKLGILSLIKYYCVIRWFTTPTLLITSELCTSKVKDQSFFFCFS